ncbi:hypothetical protein IFM51744_10346 [Aspergillus udagawae]|nr:hypothetical protein IFM51744_10346 [Aspergillus udagawae]
MLSDNLAFQPTVSTDYTTPARNIFLPQEQMENDLASGAGPRLDAFFNAPMVAKGKVHSPFTPKVAAQGRGILITKTVDPVSGNTVQSTQLLYHKFIHQIMSAAKTLGPVTSALLPLYSYLGGLQGLAPGHRGSNLAALEPFPGINTTTGQLNNTGGSVTGLMPAMSDLDEFDAALNVCHYIFNPLVQGTVMDPKEFWTFAPFKRVVT